MILLGLIFIIATILVFGAIAMLAGTAGPFFNRSTKVQRALNWLAGLVLSGWALALATTRR